ncbi:MAG: hypothetical protein VB055_11765 [Oscillospiraceae bacterium]|nr:hypothetical protein [Oscillospiraceae bacterium]
MLAENEEKAGIEQVRSKKCTAGRMDAPLEFVAVGKKQTKFIRRGAFMSTPLWIAIGAAIVCACTAIVAKKKK